MARRITRCILALFWFTFTSIVIPAHTRGAVPIPGSSPCCRHSDKSDQSTPTKPSNCAVCYLSAHLMPAVVLPVNLEPGEFLQTLEIAKLVCPFPADLVLTGPARGPPSFG
ncbi:MAG TPA: hypothetical protein VHD56_01200 [Tepidisphaeraceae bacterium]|nr:hypothetical protein [Tepidisphaeraceae bacterium]